MQEKLDIVKTVMQENIQQLLVNQESLERIESAAVHLNDQSAAFKKGAKQVADKMFWKMWKVRILIAAIVIVVLLLIIVPLAVMSKKKK